MLFDSLTDRSLNHSNIVMKNWLVNPTGHGNGFIPVDLLQEHMNLYIKVRCP